MGIRRSHRRGFSSVITNVLMCAVVISIGISVWGYTHSATSMMSTDYYEDVMESVYRIRERFYIESLGINMSSAPSFGIWIVNYGSVNVTITSILISGSGESYTYSPDVSIAPGETGIFNVDPTPVPLNENTSVSIRVESGRENRVYDSVRIPALLQGGS
ncbi:MAG: hypothetical protein HWN71_10365 [Desulfobacterales bacterium]|nr:hypothetical protein [Desulfobacterales bacterium]